MATAPVISTKEFVQRRNKVLKALKQGVALVFAGDRDSELHGSWRPNSDFLYLTGITDEPGAILMLDPGAPTDSQRVILFLRPLDREIERWDGKRHDIDSSLRKQYGILAIHRLYRLGRLLNSAVRNSGTLTCLHPYAEHDEPVSPDLAMYRKVCERIPGVNIVDGTEILPRLRSVKSKAEQACLRKACEISRCGFDEVLYTMRPGMNEFDVQETLEHAYRENGSRGPAYNTIAGSGFNGTVLHYGANNQELGKNDLIVIDSGASYEGYAADVTRTYPVSGRFTKRQREIYSIVLKALEASIKVVKAGCTFQQIDAASRKIINNAGFGDYFIHGIGHHLGIDVHDSTPKGPLKNGAVITIEPGIYLPKENLGVRIEDDVIVGTDGPTVLTKAIPKSISAIEKAMASARRS
ncbi:MAG: Xaa-Pro peptidase family protein [Phycisphaerales bacterium]|nr:Xaa-Pro peptidase family protein [Phycisphaerales bacterium]